jgi:hypothetical protein
LNDLLPYTEAVSVLARQRGRTQLGGIRFSVRGALGRLDAELMSFAGDQPTEEHALVVQTQGRPVLYVHALQDLVHQLERLGEPSSDT